MSIAEELKLIPGTPIPLGTKVYVCPALSIKLLKQFKAELRLIQGGMQLSDAVDQADKVQEFLGAVIRVGTAALLRNYPDINEDVLEDGVDLNNLKVVTLAIMGASGFKIVTQAEADAAVYGANPPGESTGTM
jgi:hypothetical protein